MPLISTLDWLPSDGGAQQLFILLHGEQGAPDDMADVAEALRAAFPYSAIVVPTGPVADTLPRSGHSWFDTQGLNEDNYVERVAQAMPELLEFVGVVQRRFGMTAEQTALVGFSQGATMALASTQQTVCVAGRVLAFSGRFAALPQTPSPACTLHLLHGKADDIVPVRYAQIAQARLGALHADSTIDVASGVGHVLHPALVARAIERLQTCVPLRSWETALGLDQHAPQGVTLH